MADPAIRKYIISLLTAILVMVTGVFSSCRVNVSFTGASISPNAKTISIGYFQNKAPLIVPTLSRDFTETLQNYFTSQTNLVLVNQNGDLNLEGSITGYTIQPAAIQGNETAALNRLTITVHVKFTNRTDEKLNFESDFSRYLDYPSTENLVTVQDQLIDGINDQIVQDIFNKAVVNW